MGRGVEVDAEQLHALVRAHKREQAGVVQRVERDLFSGDNPFVRRSR